MAISFSGTAVPPLISRRTHIKSARPIPFRRAVQIFWSRFRTRHLATARARDCIPRRSPSGTVTTRERWLERPRGAPPWAAIADTRTRENEMAAESDPRKYRIEPKIRLTDGRVIGTIAD